MASVKLCEGNTRVSRDLFIRVAQIKSIDLAPATSFTAKTLFFLFLLHQVHPSEAAIGDIGAIRHVSTPVSAASQRDLQNAFCLCSTDLRSAVFYYNFLCVILKCEIHILYVCLTLQSNRYLPTLTHTYIYFT